MLQIAPDKLDLTTQGVEIPTSRPAVNSMAEVAAFLRRRRAVILVFTLLGLLAAVAYLRSVTPLYSASATLLIDSRKQDNGIQQATILNGDPVTDSASVESQVEVLRSENVARAVIRDLDLTSDPEFVGRPPNLIGRWIATAKNWVMSFVKSPDDSPENDDPMLRALAAFDKKLDVRRSGLSYVLEISFISETAEKSAEIANAIADAYINDALEAKFRATERAGSWLNDRISDLREKTLRAEQAVQDYKAANKIVDTGGKLMSDQRVDEINTQLINARAQTAEVEARLARLEAYMNADTTNGEIADALKSDVIVKLRQQYLDIAKREADWSRRYGRDHLIVANLRDELEDVQHAIKDELTRIAKSYQSEYAIAKAQQVSLEQNLNEAIEQASTTNQSRLALRELEASAQSLRGLYDSFVKRYTEALQRQSFPITEARVITKATPPLARSSPKTTIILPGGIFFGLVAGILFAFAQDHLDRVFRSTVQVESILGTACLGLLPIVPRTAVKDRQTVVTPALKEIVFAPGTESMGYVVEAPFSRFAETLRGAKVEIDLRNLSRPTQVVGITSALPREGKTTMSSNLAHLAADAGSKTLLIDLDLRNPSLTRALAAHRSIGLLEVLAGKVPIDEALIHSPNVSLDFLPAVLRTGIAHTHDVASSHPMQQLIATMRKRYQYIVVDLPPIAPVIDVRAISPMLDCSLLVVEWGRTRQEVVVEALAFSGIESQKMLGVILNKVNLPVYRRYADIPLEYYGDYYGEYYYKGEKGSTSTTTSGASA